MVGETKNLFSFCSSSAPASRWGGWNNHSGCTLACSLVSCHRQGKQEVGGCLRPLVSDKTPPPDLTAEPHWLIDALRDFKPFTLTPIAIISIVHSDCAKIFRNGVRCHIQTWCQSQLTGNCVHSTTSRIVTFPPCLWRVKIFSFRGKSIQTSLSHSSHRWKHILTQFLRPTNPQHYTREPQMR